MQLDVKLRVIVQPLDCNSWVATAHLGIQLTKDVVAMLGSFVNHHPRWLP